MGEIPKNVQLYRKFAIGKNNYFTGFKTKMRLEILSFLMEWVNDYLKGVIANWAANHRNTKAKCFIRLDYQEGKEM